MTCTRLSDESLLDLVFGEADPETGAHAEACTDCGERLQRLEATLGRLRAAELPEPSPFYWPALRRSVGRRVERARRQWQWAPLAAAAALVAALGVATADFGRGPVSPEPALAEWVALPPAAEDAGLDVLEGALSAVEGDALVGCRGLVPCLGSLSDSESRALVDALRAELKGVES